MINIHIYLLSQNNNTEIIPFTYELFYKNKRYVILNKNDENIITKSNPIIGWIQNCIGCEAYTSRLVNIE